MNRNVGHVSFKPSFFSQHLHEQFGGVGWDGLDTLAGIAN
jgi:hypothetical protein